MQPLKKYLDLDRKTLSAVGRASVVGLHMVSGVAVGCGLGWLLDYLLGTGPWLLLVFFVLGVAAGFRNVWVDTRIILNAQDRADQADRESGASGPDASGPDASGPESKKDAQSKKTPSNIPQGTRQGRRSDDSGDTP